jgi:hypothetical protein
VPEVQAAPLAAQGAQVPATQTPEQQSVPRLQVPAAAIQQAPLLHVWPVEQPLPQLPPQPSLPHVLPVQSIGVQHVPPLTHTWPEEHETHVPIEESQY